MPAETEPPQRSQRPDAASLRRLYIDEGLTIAAVAARLGVATATAHNWLVASGVPRRKSPSTTRADLSDVEIRRLYAVEGWTAAEIAGHLGCPTTTVYARLQGLGVPRRPAQPRHCSRPVDSELRQLYLENGLNQRQLARQFSVSPQAVSAWLKAAGIPTRGPVGQPPSATSASIADLYGQGWSGPRIAARLGCSPSTVYRRLEAAGLDRRRRRPALERPALLESLDAGLSATDIASRFEVSVKTVCGTLAREGLYTPSQTKRRQDTEHYAALLTAAATSDRADPATVEWLRRRLRQDQDRPVNA